MWFQTTYVIHAGAFIGVVIGAPVVAVLSGIGLWHVVQWGRKIVRDGYRPTLAPPDAEAGPEVADAPPVGKAHGSFSRSPRTAPPPQGKAGVDPSSSDTEWEYENGNGNGHGSFFVKVLLPTVLVAASVAFVVARLTN